MGKRAALKAVEKKLSQLGYQFARSNSNNWLVFARAGFPDVAVNPSIGEREARFLVKRLDRQHGIEPESHKRNAQAVKERQRIERQRIRAEMDRLDAERARLIRDKELIPTGAFDSMARNQRLALERELQRIDNERREFVRLMTQLESVSA